MLCCLALIALGSLGDVSKHNVTWTALLPEPGVNKEGVPTYHNSMPLGNGNLAANVNYDAANDTLAVLLSSAAAWSEDGETMKVGLLRIQLPAGSGAAVLTGAAAGFAQAFNPQDATVRLSIPAAAGGAAPALRVVAYADAATDSIVVSVSPRVAGVTATLTALRPAAFSRRPSQDCNTYAVSADVLTAGGAMLYHRNALQAGDTYYARTFGRLNQKLEPGFADPLLNRTTGVMLAQLSTTAGPGAGADATTFAATVLTAQTETAAAYEALLTAASAAFVAAQQEAPCLPPPAHSAWWAAKWAAHSIEVSDNNNKAHSIEVSASASAGAGVASTTARVSTMYVLQRFLELAQSRGPSPIKFNGMLYVANRPNPSTHASDFNTWGGLHWWQNARLPHYNMLTMYVQLAVAPTPALLLSRPGPPFAFAAAPALTSSFACSPAPLVPPPARALVTGATRTSSRTC